ncbi:FtsK/SpoIIIE domain-containing protein [Litchfieldella qijiaojingensis]|uniref:FtsK/SpoIIIE domain-containing protein n=1 Tax=Litchfieldella qijiaojingensis TaxID=980347 RepID=UPI0016798A3D|nr:FtsK/SpoIIIE domain-containing protein [Halomonas qijiaojingensis]
MTEGYRCDICHRKGDLVGKVVWDIVGAAVREATSNDRVTFMLTGLSAVFLEGIARQAPNKGAQIEGRSLLLAVNPLAAPHLRIHSPARSSDESAVHWRHSTAAQVILFAPSDAEREGIGAGLGPLARIDDRAIVDHTSAWLQALDETGSADTYMRAMLEGLRSSQIFIDLEMWVDFVIAIQDQGFALPPHLRIQHAVPALRIPRGGVTKLPAFKLGGNPKARTKDFRSAFQTARSEVSVFAGLMTPKQEPVDTQAVGAALAEFDNQDDEEIQGALKAVRALLDDEINIRPGEWRESQRTFCERVPWDRIGASLFMGGRKTSRKSLGVETLDFIEGNYADDVTDDDRRLLEELKDTIPKEPKDDELEFFARWQERLNHPKVIKLYKAWQKRLFSKEVIGHDLLSAFSDGFEALIIAGAESLAEMDDPRVLVRASQHNKAMFWESLDAGAQKLFRFELRSVLGLFGERVLWDLDACFRHDAEGDSTSADARKVDLELYLVEASDVSDLGALKTPPRAAPRVKTTWQPGQKPKEEPIALALPDDISSLAIAAKNDAGLFRRQVFAPRADADGSRIASTTLQDVKSFSDVAQAQDGRTFDTTVQTSDDVIGELRVKISELASTRSLDHAASVEMLSALDTFDAAYKSTILAIAEDPKTGFEGDAVAAQANAFGALCTACRRHATSDRSKKELRPLVAEIGIVPSDGSDRMAILTAWHPFRLAERQAKIRNLAKFVEAVLESRTAHNTDLTIVFEERRALTARWVFPETAVVDDVTMISVEDVAGYSLLVPADCVTRSQEALEGSAPSAAAKFIEGVNQYLEVHPHESANLTAAIYDSESLTLPREIARLLAQRIHRDPDLRCDFVITHHDQARLRSIYRSQNMRLDAENISETAKGFLSRLRVDVRPNRSAQGLEDTIRDMDLVFLHDAVSHHAVPEWELERGKTEDLSPDFDLAPARKPRRRLTEVGAPGVGIYLTLPRPPRSVAEYHDLLYEMDKAAVLPNDSHAVLIHHVQFDNAHVVDLIRRAHELAEWVVTYDKVSSRTLLEKCGVQIIRDISVPGSEGRVIISAGKIDERLKTNVRQDLVEACGIDMEAATLLGDVVLNDVVRISGQKVLSAARFANASHEMIGLSLMRAHLEASLPKGLPETARPIWVSLDDYRGWFMSGTGKIADAIGVTILDTGTGFEILVQVGEAKFVGLANEMAETKEARRQVRDTVDRVRRIFIDNEDPISRQAWCARLVDLLVNREGLSERLPDALRRAAFLEALGAGDVTFRLSGEAVICLHDDHGTSPRLESDMDHPHLRHHILPTPIILQTLRTVAEGEVPDRAELRDARWYAGESATQTTQACMNETEMSSSEPSFESSPLIGTDPGESLGSDIPFKETSFAPVNFETEVPSETGTSEERGEVETQELPTLITGKEAPRFIPTPVYAVLQAMAAREEGAIDDPESITWAEKICEDTQRALSHFGMQAHFAEPRYRLTPNGALITFRGHETLTVDKIDRRTGELLTTYGIEVVDVRPGRGKISLFVKRDQRAKVPLASTWLQSPWPDREPSELTNFILGAREDDDRLLFLNISGEFGGYEEHGPHTLIAGETGSGKGILTQGLLLQLITFNDPDKAELILVDPKKGVDFGWLNGTPHMKGPIITEIQEAQEAFEDLVQRMDERYERFAEVGAQNITYYNQKVAPQDRMSRIFLVHDEMGAWMAQEKEYQDVVLSAVANLGMKARAAGIHLILITQRADADAVPTRLRDNMNNRLCLKVQNSTGSRMVLGIGGAEKLLGKGHLACIMANQSPPVGQNFFVIQVPFAEPEDIQDLASAAIAYWSALYP